LLKLITFPVQTKEINASWNISPSNVTNLTDYIETDLNVSDLRGLPQKEMEIRLTCIVDLKI
jgi:hypothetical protein